MSNTNQNIFNMYTKKIFMKLQKKNFPAYHKYHLTTEQKLL